MIYGDLNNLYYKKSVLLNKDRAGLMFSNLEQMVSKLKIDLSSLDILFSSVGPGNFNGIRISLKDSGCSGYAYNLDYVKDEDPNDYHGNFSGVDVYIKDTSLIFLKGTELDFIQEGVNHNLVFKNPNVENECGCGESFTFSNKPFAELK